MNLSDRMRTQLYELAKELAELEKLESERPLM